MQNEDPIFEEFYYIVSSLYNRVTRRHALMLYNECRKDKRISDDKIIYAANLLRQKENVVNE